MTSITRSDFILYGQYFYINKSNSNNAFNNGINSIYYPQNQFLLTTTNATDQSYNYMNIPVDVNNSGRYYSLNIFLVFVGNYYDKNPTIVSTIIYGDSDYTKNLINVFNLINDQYTGIISYWK
jgi:hypothetical protein